MNQVIDRFAAVQVDLGSDIAAASGMAAGFLSLYQAGAPLPADSARADPGWPRRPLDNRLRNRLAAFIQKLVLRDHE